MYVFCTYTRNVSFIVGVTLKIRLNGFIILIIYILNITVKLIVDIY